MQKKAKALSTFVIPYKNAIEAPSTNIKVKLKIETNEYFVELYRDNQFDSIFRVCITNLKLRKTLLEKFRQKFLIIILSNNEKD